MVRIKAFILGVLLMFCGGALLAQQRDSIRFSLLTCAPGQEIYSLFGHTAIRYENYTRNIDLVFNYGMFSFNTPNFVWRFVKGETDYQLGIAPFDYFEAEYTLRGSSVYQQVLDLRYEEKLRLLKSLQDNYLPQNRTYRYNYFYDNCTTRTRDRIEQCIEGKVVYADSLTGKTFRSIVHEFTATSPWGEFGIDLCLGKEADMEINNRQQMFSPFYMKEYASQAIVVREDGSKSSLVLSEYKIVDAAPLVKESSWGLTPFPCALLWLIVCALFAICQWRHRRFCWAWSSFLLFVQGAAGCIIAFLFFFSVHPTVGSNWMLFFLNPVPLFYLPVLIYRGIKGQKDYFHWVNVVYLTLFIGIILFSGQKINLTVLPLALGLLLNSVAYILVWNKRQ